MEGEEKNSKDNENGTVLLVNKVILYRIYCLGSDILIRLYRV